MTNFEPQKTSIESRADRIRELNRAMAELLIEQEKQIPIPSRPNDEIEREAIAVQQTIEEMDRHIIELKKETERIDRFYREYWQLLLLIARKANWIDDEDVKELEEENW